MIAFHVSDMTGPRCVAAVTRAILGVDRGAQVRVDLPTLTVEIEPSHASAKALGDAILRAGYSPVAA